MFFFTSSRIEQLPGPLHRLPEVRIADGLGHDEVYRPTEELLESNEQAEVGIGVLIFLQGKKFHKKVDVACVCILGFAKLNACHSGNRNSIIRNPAV